MLAHLAVPHSARARHTAAAHGSFDTIRGATLYLLQALTFEEWSATLDEYSSALPALSTFTYAYFDAAAVLGGFFFVNMVNTRARPGAPRIARLARLARLRRRPPRPPLPPPPVATRAPPRAPPLGARSSWRLSLMR